MSDDSAEGPALSAGGKDVEDNGKDEAACSGAKTPVSSEEGIMDQASTDDGSRSEAGVVARNKEEGGVEGMPLPNGRGE